ncbi:hypothetical protein GCK32_021496, partial [Trichostrongylus colubriformis]
YFRAMHWSKVILLLALLCLAFGEAAKAAKKDTKDVGTHKASKKSASSKVHTKSKKTRRSKSKVKHHKKKSCKNC